MDMEYCSHRVCMSVSVCLHILKTTSKFHHIFYACCLWIGLPLTTNGTLCTLSSVEDVVFLYNCQRWAMQIGCIFKGNHKRAALEQSLVAIQYVIFIVHSKADISQLNPLYCELKNNGKKLKKNEKKKKSHEYQRQSENRGGNKNEKRWE